MERGRGALRNQSTANAHSGTPVQRADVHPARESVRNVRGALHLSSAGLIKGAAHRYRRYRGSESDAAGGHGDGSAADGGGLEDAPAGSTYSPPSGSSR